MMRRLIIGKHPTEGRYGLWLSRRGNDAAGPDDGLLLSSDREYMNIYMRGEFQLGYSGGIWTGSVDFALPFVPVFMAYAFQRTGDYTTTTPMMSTGNTSRIFAAPGKITCNVYGYTNAPVYCSYTIFTNQLF